MKFVTFGLCAAVHVYAQCTGDWCNFGTLDAYYKCNFDADPLDTNCMKSRISLKDEHEKYISLEYQLPALRDGAEADYQEFQLTNIMGESTKDDDKALFKLATSLNFGEDTLAYLGVVQAVAFKDFTSKSIVMPQIPDVNPNLDVCWAENDGEDCKSKTFTAGSFKWSFAAYQVKDCANPDDCFFFMRSVIDAKLLEVGLADIYFNGDKSVTAEGEAFGESFIVKSIHLKGQVFKFPEGVNVNNQEWMANGCTVHLEERTTDDMRLHLAFKVKAPGAGKFVMYDPDVSAASIIDLDSASVPSATTTVSAVAMLGFAAMFA